MPVVDIPDVGAVEFPESMSAEDIGSAAEDLYLQQTMPGEFAASKQAQSEEVEDSGFLGQLWNDVLTRPVADLTKAASVGKQIQYLTGKRGVAMTEEDYPMWRSVQLNTLNKMAFPEGLTPGSFERHETFTDTQNPNYADVDRKLKAYFDSRVKGQTLTSFVMPPENINAILAKGELPEIPDQAPQKGGSLGQVAGGAVTGIENFVLGTIGFFTSPLGIVAPAVSSIGSKTKAATALGFAAMMGSHLPEQWSQFRDALAKGDTGTAAQIGTEGVLTLLGAGVAGAHGLAEGIKSFRGKPAAPVEIVAPQTSEALKQSTEILKTEEVIPNEIQPETMRPVEVTPEVQPIQGVEGVRPEPAPETPVRSAEAVKGGETVETQIQKGPQEVLDQGKAVAEPALGEATAVPETPSSQRIGIIPEGTQLSMETVGNPGWWSRYFTSSRGLPEGVPEAWLKRMGEVRSETRGATYAARDLANALREEYGIGVRKLATSGLSDVPKPTMDSIQKVLTGQADINTLPERLRDPVQKIRKHVDALSTKIMERLGEDNPLTAKIGSNLGVYLTRSYRIFDDPKWVEKIPVEVRNQAESFLADQLGEKAGVPAEVMRDQSRTKLREMLADWSDNGLDKLMRGGKLGAKDLSLFMQRKDIAPSIRAVMGEYGDPVTNYIRSITKMSRWLGDQEFLDTVRQKGMGQWLFEEGQSPAGFEHQIAAEGSQTMSPLNGLRTSEAIKDVFENFNKSQVSDSLIARVYFALNAWSKQAKTVFSALTQARNFIGNPFFNIKSGHFNFRDYGKAFKTQLADIAGSDKAAQEFYKDMTKYGLVDENPVVGELRASIRDAGLRDPSFEDYSMKGSARVLRLAIESPQRAYRIPDEMGKTVGWLAEQADLRSAHPDWTDAQVKQEAATRIRNEYPTYSMIPEAVQQFRKQPFIGPFVNFAYETVRNGFWALRNGSSDLFSGENAAQRRHGAKKLAGFGAVLASGTALTKLGQQAFNIQKESDEDIRRFLPDYAKNNELLIYDKDGTKLRYINYSYLNPYSQMTDPFVAALNNDQPGIINGAAAAFGEFIKPFANEQMLAGAIEEVVRNLDSSDHRIYNPQADGNEIFEKVSERLLRSIEPGSLERFRRRIWPAMTGEPWPSGDERNLGLEVFSELSGLRMEQKDLTKIFGFKVREFVQEDSRDARKLATSVLFSSKPPTTEEALAAYQNADDARFRLWQSLYQDYSAVIRQGGEPREIRKILSEGGLSTTDINQLSRGNYIPLKIDAQDYRDAGKPVQKDSLAAVLAERKNRAGKRLE